MRRTISTIALVLGLAIASACTPAQAAAWLNSHGKGPVAAESADAERAAGLFTAYWKAVLGGGGSQSGNLVARWQGVANCESGGNWSANTGNGYYGGVQFSLATWRSVGGPGYPHQQSAATQAHYAEILKNRAGLGQWPHCGRNYR